MTTSRHCIIQAALKLANVLTDLDKLDILLRLLETNPTIVVNAMGIKDESKDESKETELFKVIVNVYREANKMTLIKAFRAIRGSGLVEAKNWCEGKDFIRGESVTQSGVVEEHLSHHAAQELATRMRHELYHSPYFSVRVVPDSAKVERLPNDWINLPFNPHT